MTPGSIRAARLIDERDRQAFLDILSHELRTPVTTIYGGAQLLAKRDLKADRRRALAEDVRVEADRLYRLVEDLVILVHSERDGIRPVGEPVAVGRLVSAAIEREVARHPGVKIALLGASDAAADGADEEMVTHVIRNLLDNAIRYGGEQGSDRGRRRGDRQRGGGPRQRPGRRPRDQHDQPFGLSATQAGDGGGASRCRDRPVRRGSPRSGDGRPDVGGPRAPGRAPSSGSRWRGRRGRVPPQA